MYQYKFSKKKKQLYKKTYMNKKLIKSNVLRNNACIHRPGFNFLYYSFSSSFSSSSLMSLSLKCLAD